MRGGRWVSIAGAECERCDRAVLLRVHKNATVYGEGVYFAVGAAPWSIRDTYSPPDDQGFKYMYLARVAVGEFCEGDSSMRVPPAQPGTGDLLPYDATVDNVREPEMYVAYHDAQAYPEYLVTIRCA